MYKDVLKSMKNIVAFFLNYLPKISKWISSKQSTFLTPPQEAIFFIRFI